MNFLKNYKSQLSFIYYYFIYFVYFFVSCFLILAFYLEDLLYIYFFDFITNLLFYNDVIKPYFEFLVINPIVKLKLYNYLLLIFLTIFISCFLIIYLYLYCIKLLTKNSRFLLYYYLCFSFNNLFLIYWHFKILVSFFLNYYINNNYNAPFSVLNITQHCLDIEHLLSLILLIFKIQILSYIFIIYLFLQKQCNKSSFYYFYKIFFSYLIFIISLYFIFKVQYLTILFFCFEILYFIFIHLLYNIYLSFYIYYQKSYTFEYFYKINFKTYIYNFINFN